MVQLKKGGELQALLGMQAALTVTMNRTPGGPEINLAGMPDAGTVSRNHAVIELTDDNPTLTDLNSANCDAHQRPRHSNPDTATPFGAGDTLSFGKVTCTFRKG